MKIDTIDRAPAGGSERGYHHGDLRQALVDAAVDLLAEQQDFCLREVARRAQVSHNAPYNHFGGKHELLGAVAALGFERLGERMQRAVAASATPENALVAAGKAYVEFAEKNLAWYRLMFGPEFACDGEGKPQACQVAGACAKAVLEDIVRAGCESGVFSVAAADEEGQRWIVLTTWSTLHGLALLLLEMKEPTGLKTKATVQRVLDVLLQGLRSGGT